MSRRQRPRIGLGVIIGLSILFFFLPLYAAAKFGFYSDFRGFSLDPLRAVTRIVGFRSDLWISGQLAILTTIISLLLMVPTLVWLHLKVPRLRPVAELVSILPYVVPAIALVAGASKTFRNVWPWIIVSPLGMIPLYVIVALPFTYRSLDGGLSAIDLRTLAEASRSLGAGWMRTITSVVIPNMATAMLGAAILTMAVVLGEYTIAALLLHNTFPVFLVQATGNEPQGGPALSIVAILVTWLLLGMLSFVQRKGKSKGQLPQDVDGIGVAQIGRIEP